jgi:uncharacterized SAM-binding protein YcdF (DUF218 family)
MHDIYTIFKLFLGPEVFIFIILIASCFAVWMRQGHRFARGTLFLVLVLYYGFTTRPLTHALLEPLETYHRPPVSMPVQQDAIVIFIGSPKVQPYTVRPTIVGTRDASLLLCGLAYIHAGSAPKVVLTGRVSGEVNHTTAGAVVLQEWAALLGYPRESLIIEHQTEATHDRAQAVKQLLGRESRILLLDSAMHLPRSAAAFQKAGFTVTPIPCDYEMSTDSWNLSDFVPQGKHLRGSSAAVHEYLGLLTYRLRGFI